MCRSVCSMAALQVCVTCGERHLYHHLAIDQLFGQLMWLVVARCSAMTLHLYPWILDRILRVLCYSPSMSQCSGVQTVRCEPFPAGLRKICDNKFLLYGIREYVISKRSFLDCWAVDHEGTTIFRNVGSRSPNITASHPRILELYAAPPREPQISHWGQYRLSSCWRLVRGKDWNTK